MQAELSRTIKEHVYHEIDVSLRDARYALEAYLDENSEGTELAQCASLIEEVDGAISLLQRQSLSLLSHSLLELVLKLKSDGVEYPELALELLIKGMGVIPNYLYLMDSGVEEYDSFFVPFVNDINQLLGKEHIFDDLSDLDMPLPDELSQADDSGADVGEIDRAYFQAKRPEFLKALLALYRSSDLNVKDLFPLINLLDEFSEKSKGSPISEYFLISRNIIENIKGLDKDSIRSSKILMGRIDKLVKHLIDPSAGLSDDEVAELGKRLFYKLITVKSDSSELQKLKERYKINEQLTPRLDKISMYRDFVSGPNTESYETLAHTIYNEIGNIRESIELYLVERDISRFSEIREPVNTLANVIVILGYSEKGKQLHELVGEIDSAIQAGGEIDETLLEKVAYQIVDLERYISQLAYLRTVEKSDLYTRIQNYEETHLYSDLSKLIYDTVSKISSHLLELKKTKVLTDQADIILEHLIELRGVYKFFFSDQFDYVFSTCIEFVTDKKNKQVQLEDFKVFALLLADLEGLFDSYIQNFEIDEELSEKIRIASEEVAASTLGLDEFLSPELNPEDNAMSDFVSELTQSAMDEVADQGLESTPEQIIQTEAQEVEPFTDEEFETLLSALDEEPDSNAGESLDSVKYFLEEATSALQVIRHLTPKWLENIADNELLNEIITSFSSIKNSAKLANAGEVSNLSGLLEKMLLELQAQNLGYSLAIGDILTESVALISDYVEQYRQSDVSRFHDQINELCEAVESILSIERGERQARETEEPASAISQQRALEPELHEIYEKETLSHIQTISRVIEKCQSDSVKCLVTDDLIRALHTMHGSSHMADVHDVADVTGLLEERFVELQNLGFQLNDNAIALLQDFSTAVQTLLPELSHDGAALHNKQSLMTRAEELVAEAQAEGQVIEDVFFDFDRPDELAEIFLEEAEEILGRIDTSLTQWDSDGDNKTHINEIERSLHTLKGGSRMASIGILADISHAVESKLKVYLDEGSGNPSDLNRIVQKSQEQLIKIVDAVKKGVGTSVDGQLLTELELYPDEVPAVEAVAEEVAESGFLDLDAELDLGDLDMELELDDENQLDESLLDEELPVEVSAAATDIIEHSVEPEQEESIGLAESDTEQVVANEVAESVANIEQSLETTVKQGVEQVRVRSDILDSLIKQASETNIVNSNLEQHFSGFKQNLEELNTTVERLRTQLRQLEIETESQIVYRMDGSSGTITSDFDPLEFDRFTQLQTLSRSMLESLSDLESIESAINREISSSEKTLTQQTRVSQDLQDGLLRTRMTPFSTVIPRLTRIVNQTSDELNKQVEFHVSGDSSEVDGTLLTKIISPIEHILRNAVYHGIERSEIREARGKNPVGKVSLNLAYERSELIITISDDGAGLNTDAIRGKAVLLGMLPKDSSISDEDAAQLILQSGLSTAEELSQISGRGVGMDVVNTEVKNVGGTLHIATKKNNGTTFTMHLPTKLSLLQALVVQEEGNNYAIPIIGIEGIENVRGDKLLASMTDMDNTLIWYDETYRLVSLSELIGFSKDVIFSAEEKYPVIFGSFGDYRVAVFVDDYLGNKEIVTKPLGPQLDSIRGLMGGAIMADGSVALILDLSSLARPGIKSVLQKYSNAQKSTSERKVVLVVDDSITVRKISEKFLTSNNYSVLSAKDGIDALSVLEDHTPDVILLDIEMPRMNGYDLLQHIRQDERMKTIPIIMITSRTGEKHKIKALELGANAYFGKPYNETELLSQIEKLL